MNNKKAFLFLIPIIILLGCGENEPEIKKILTLSDSEIELWIGSQREVEILSDVSDPTASSDNKDICIASIEGNKILISAKKNGVAVVTVRDSNNKKGNIKVASVTMQNSWKESIDLPFDYIEEIITDDPEVTETIKTDIQNNLENRNGTLYSFYSDGETVDIKLKNTESYITGGFSLQDNVFRIKYEDLEEVYDFIPLSLVSVRLRQDMTSYYQTLYSHNKIESVIVNKLLGRVYR